MKRVNCPNCSSPEVKIPLSKSLHRVVAIKCRGCSSEFVSEAPRLIYLMTMVYLHLTVPLMGAFLIVGVLGGNYVLISVSVFVIATLLSVPVIALHPFLSVIRFRPISEPITKKSYRTRPPQKDIDNNS